MIQGIMELIFAAAYLITAMTIGIFLVTKAKTKFFTLFGVMAILLSAGDAFHLIPRVISLLSDILGDEAFALGLGKLITSITMTGFYLIFYFVLEITYKPTKKESIWFRCSLLFLVLSRIVLCALPQNDWFIKGGDLLFGILRNIPFALIGIIIIVMCFLVYKRTLNKDYLWLAIFVILSFGFYIPVVLLSDKYPLVGTLMIPKTLCYVGMMIIGLQMFLKEQKIKQLVANINEDIKA